MANTYSQIYIQIVFAVRGRQNLIAENSREELQKYISGIVTNRGQKLISIYCMPDHIHLLVGLKPSLAIADLVRDVKAGSSKFIKEKGWMKSRFEWQEGYGAFSYSHSQLKNVIGYINNQKEHHRGNTFKEEYVDFLHKFNVDFNDQYLFEWIE
ncbi:MAG: IS200/IS605 family transposase [Bacteroidota bacterium]